MSLTGGLIHWFRIDLRLHDNPSVAAALKKCSTLYPVYIFDENDFVQGKMTYNKLRFILESLEDIENKMKEHGGRIYIFKGQPVEILKSLFKRWGINYLSYEEDTTPTWKDMEAELLSCCRENNIEIIKKVSHTLWNPVDIVKANNGRPPVTYSVLCHVVESLGFPSRPESNVNFTGIDFPSDEVSEFSLPLTPKNFGIESESEEKTNNVWKGGETRALKHLEERLQIEKEAYASCISMPNQVQPDLLGPPMSMSAALSLGCLSVRKFYWSLQDLQDNEDSTNFVVPDGLMGQLIWREYFYAMSLNNPYYGMMEKNPICLNIPWVSNDSHLRSWTEGKTGFPFIDAAMRQMVKEGWIHHVARNAVACFLTRGDLWISWEEGFKVFMKYLIDADFAVCAGNWMWVSSSAFETILQCPSCISPVFYARRVEPTGNYIRKYVPELAKLSNKYIFEPWLAPKHVQEQSHCIIGEDYPFPIVDHEELANRNTGWMNEIKGAFLSKDRPLHCAPSNDEEARFFMWLPKECIQNLVSCQ